MRLLKVLNELSLRGCLGVLIACLQDSDLEVIKKAILTVDKMMSSFNKYNFMNEFKKVKNGTPNNAGAAIPVIDINYADFDRNTAGTKDPTERNNADFSQTTEISVSSTKKTCTKQCADYVIIDSIVQSDDLHLLSNTCKKNLTLCEKVELGQIDEDLFKKYATVTPEQFISFITSNDLNEIVRNKSEWLQHCENFSTLLDDVLRSFENDMDLDCY